MYCLQAGAVQRAIDIVGRTQEAPLGALIAEHLATYPPAQSTALLSSLYLALGRLEDTAAAALHAAHEEREAGNYKVRALSTCSRPSACSAFRSQVDLVTEQCVTGSAHHVRAYRDCRHHIISPSKYVVQG